MSSYRDSDAGSENVQAAKVVKKAGIGAGALLGLVVLNGAWFTVNPNDRANVRHFGSPKYSEPLQSGVHFKWPLIDSVDRVQTALTTQEIPSIDVGTVDNQRVKLDINFNYDIPDSEVNRVLYHIGSTGNKDIQDQVAKTVESVAVDVIAKQNMNSLNSQLEPVRQEMQTEAAEQLKNLYGIHEDRLQIKAITPSDAFMESNKLAVNAKNAAVAAENQLKTVQFQAEQQVAQAKGQADSAIARAEGQKQAAILEGEGNEARYNSEIKALGGPANYIAYKRAEAALKWDGKVPQVVSGGNGAGTNLVVPLNLDGPTK